MSSNILLFVFIGLFALSLLVSVVMSWRVISRRLKYRAGIRKRDRQFRPDRPDRHYRIDHR